MFITKNSMQPPRQELCPREYTRDQWESEILKSSDISFFFLMYSSVGNDFTQAVLCLALEGCRYTVTSGSMETQAAVWRSHRSCVWSHECGCWPGGYSGYSGKKQTLGWQHTSSIVSSKCCFVRETPKHLCGLENIPIAFIDKAVRKIRKRAVLPHFWFP